MKKALSSMVLIFLVALGVAVQAASSETGLMAKPGGPSAIGRQDPGADLDMDYCYNYLAPYGNWVNLDPWGYVWCPRNMGYRWRPYSDGHWVWTDDGWTWISDLEWGWMPFHYGRWGWNDDIGWFWVPGTSWGPAWVCWRSNDLYMGWAPFPPGLEFRAGMNFAMFGMDIPGRFWIFIGCSHFMDGEIYDSVLPFERNEMIVGATALRNDFRFRGNRFVNQGMGIDAVRLATGHEVKRYSLQDVRQPGPMRMSGNTIQVYRPALKANAIVQPKAALDKNRAQQELATAKIFEPRTIPPKLETESAVLKRQSLERRLLTDSQAKDVKALSQNRLADQKNASAGVDKTKLQKDYQARISQVTQQHQVEKQQLTTRHTADAAQVKQVFKARTTTQVEKKKK
jgi:hypothetical protein